MSTSFAVGDEAFDLVDRLSQITAGFATVRDLPDLADRVDLAMSALIDATYTGVYLFDFEAGGLRLLYASGFSEAERREAERTAWERHPGQVFRSNTELDIEDTQADGRSSSSKRSFAVRSRLFIPVVSGSSVLGVIGLASTEPRAFTHRHRSLLRFLCHLTGVVYGQLLERTAKRRARKDLAAAAQRLQLVLDALPIALAVTNPDGRLDMAQGAALHLLGAVEVGGRLAAGGDVGEVIERAIVGTPAGEATVETLQVGEQYLQLHLRRRASGESAALIFDVTERQAAIDTLRELNEQLAMARDDALSATRAKSEFLATMSHELRTPLNGIIGYAELAADELELGEVDAIGGDIERILTSARNLLGIINDILDLSKIEAGRMELHPEDLSLQVLIDEVRHELDPLAERRSNRLAMRLEGGEVEIRCDRIALRKVLVNLVGNAIKFTENGQVQVCVLTPAVGWVMLVVRDDGIGMTDQQLSRVFDAFTQADGSTSRRYGGTGLGLTITSKLVQMMGGQIDVRSEKGKGTVFRVLLPLMPGVVSDPPELHQQRDLDDPIVLAPCFPEGAA